MPPNRRSSRTPPSRPLLEETRPKPTMRWDFGHVIPGQSQVVDGTTILRGGPVRHTSPGLPSEPSRLNRALNMNQQQRGMLQQPQQQGGYAPVNLSQAGQPLMLQGTHANRGLDFEEKREMVLQPEHLVTPGQKREVVIIKGRTEQTPEDYAELQEYFWPDARISVEDLPTAGAMVGDVASMRRAARVRTAAEGIAKASAVIPGTGKLAGAATKLGSRYLAEPAVVGAGSALGELGRQQLQTDNIQTSSGNEFRILRGAENNLAQADLEKQRPEFSAESGQYQNKYGEAPVFGEGLLSGMASGADQLLRKTPYVGDTYGQVSDAVQSRAEGHLPTDWSYEKTPDKGDYSERAWTAAVTGTNDAMIQMTLGGLQNLVGKGGRTLKRMALGGQAQRGALGQAYPNIDFDEVSTQMNETWIRSGGPPVPRSLNPFREPPSLQEGRRFAGRGGLFAGGTSISPEGLQKLEGLTGLSVRLSDDMIDVVDSANYQRYLVDKQDAGLAKFKSLMDDPRWSHVEPKDWDALWNQMKREGHRGFSAKALFEKEIDEIQTEVMGAMSGKRGNRVYNLGELDAALGPEDRRDIAFRIGERLRNDLVLSSDPWRRLKGLSEIKKYLDEQSVKAYADASHAIPGMSAEITAKAYQAYATAIRNKIAKEMEQHSGQLAQNYWAQSYRTQATHAMRAAYQKQLYGRAPIEGIGKGAGLQAAGKGITGDFGGAAGAAALAGGITRPVKNWTADQLARGARLNPITMGTRGLSALQSPSHEQGRSIEDTPLYSGPNQGLMYQNLMRRLDRSR